ncbi:MAG: ABC transporter substrate-binding protein [Anaerolineaceae bacterium]
MKKLRWQLLIIFLTGLVVGILLISEQPERETPLATVEPQSGGVYVEALVGEFQRLNPVLDFYNPPDQDLDRLLYSSLVTFKERGIPQGDLAESWGISKDGTVYNFTLRSDAQWHDGSPVISDDILFTINLLREGIGVVPEDIRNFWNEIDVKSLSETKMQFSLPEPFAPFLDYLSFRILPSHLLGNLSFVEILNSSFNLQPIGSGPYKFGSLVVEGDQILGVVLNSNEDYYGEKPFIDQLVFRYYTTSEDAFLAYKDGQVQGISSVENTTLSEVLNDSQLSIYSARKPELSMILLNLNNEQVPFFKDPVIRKALLTGLNRQRIIDRVLNGQAIIADGPILPGTWAYYEGLESIAFHSENAIEMLKENGYILSGEEGGVRAKDKVELRFELLYPDTEEHRKIAEMIQVDWENLGAIVDIRAVPYEELIKNHLEPRDFQAVLIDQNLANTPDPDPYPFWDQVQATGGQNYSQWDSTVASDYLEQARVTTNLIERASLYRNFQVVFAEDLPALPLFYPVYTFAVSSQINGIQIGPLFSSSDRFMTVSDWFIAGPQVQNQSIGGTATPEE